jgi:hypothetical protein
MTDQLTTIAGLAEELTDPRQHRETLWSWSPSRHRIKTGEHITVQPGLLEQLRDAIYPSATIGDNTSPRSLPQSKPPLLLEALSHHIAITMGANRWIWELRAINNGTPESNIRTLVGAAARADDDTRRELTADLRRWRNWAAVMTGWANPPMTPRVPCPNPDCAQMSTLRILPERRAGMCSKCDRVWDDTDGTIEALAEWVTNYANNPTPTARIRSGAAGHGGWMTRHAVNPA